MQPFFHELKRRGVGRVALAYVAASWLLVQIMETVFPLYELDDGYIRIVILVLAVGFVPALGLAWAFEWSPGGLRTQAAIDRDPSAAQSDGRLLDRAIIVVLSIAVLLFSVDKFLGSESPDTEVSNKTIAVLPFDDLTEAGDQAYFADGLAEELLNLLARNPALRVAARTSSFSFRNAELPIDAIAERLGVKHVVEGSVRRSADRIRVTAQLISAADGFHLWSQTYDASLDDIFDIQSNISQQIAEALEVTMAGGIEAPQATAPEAYALYLQAVHRARQGSSADLHESARILEQVLEMDPLYAPALTNLSAVTSNLAARGEVDYDVGYNKARELALRAVESQPNFSGGYLQLSWIAQGYDGDLAAAVTHMQKALEINPGSPAILGNAAVLLMHTGQLGASIELAEESAALSPVDPGAFFNLGLAYAYADRLDEAMQAFDRTVSLSPDYLEAAYQRGLVQLLKSQPEDALATWNALPASYNRVKGNALARFALGQTDEADAALQELIDGWGEEWPSVVVHVYAYRQDLEMAFAWLEKEYEKFGAAGWGEWKYQRLFDNMRPDPRWDAFLERVGVSDEQLAAYELSLPKEP